MIFIDKIIVGVFTLILLMEKILIDNKRNMSMDSYSADYTLNSLVELGYLSQKDIDDLLTVWHTKEKIVWTVVDLLLKD